MYRKTKILSLISLLNIVVGCASSQDLADARNRVIAQALRDGRSPFPTSTLTIYSIPHGVQRDDSVFIDNNELNRLAKMAVCPEVPINDNPYSYRAQAIIDRQDMTVKVNINRGGCTIDTSAVKSYLDAAIIENRRKNSEMFERTRREREVSPRGPYKLGCVAYQQHIKGYSDVTTIDTAINLYPKLNSNYVKNLFTTGWDDAKLYGARGVDCEYLSSFVR